ncbi:MAG: RNHCP domain-containing protein [Oscillospiraceae bacterium]|nr:RNHCP domain-containing protein [Oscillospiraceae bacterium]
MDRNRPDYRNTACEERFTCKVCGALVSPEDAGSLHRNHCPKCLSSVHVDIEPGDRLSVCRGTMDPISVWVRKNGEWAIIHRCRICGELISNRIAADDNPALLMSIAVKPLAMPPFPLGLLGQETMKGR